MAGIDFYKSVDMDVSVILKYPKEMTGALTSMQEILKARGKIIIDEGDLTVNRARELVANASGDTTYYYQFRSTNDKVWAILRESVEEDRIRILGLVHGITPPSVPQNVVTLDVGQSLHRKASKAIIGELVDSMKTKGKYPVGDPEQLYYATQALCYEVLYESDYRMFPKDVTHWIPRSEAFSFMYNPPKVLTPQTMRAAVLRFVESKHNGWMV